MTLMRKTLITLAATLAVMSLAGTAGASPPLPLPNPDRPAATPVAGGQATTSANPVCPALRRTVRSGNGGASLMVKNLGNGKTVCSLNPKTRRSLASNTKIFTTVTALGRLGTGHRMLTKVFSDGGLRNGVLSGNLYLRGGGDPSLGTPGFLDAYLAGAGSDIDRLAAAVRRSGIRRITGRVYGDDTVFDRLRGVADSGYRTSPYVGPLSGLSINAGFTGASLNRFSSNPAKLAAKSLVRSLKKRGVSVRGDVALRKSPSGGERRLRARLPSPDMAWMSRVTNVNSNNFFAEMLLKHIGSEARGSGTTRAGAAVVRRYVKSKFDAVVRPLDGSGLTFGNRSSAGDIVRLLNRVRKRGFGDAFAGSLAVAGRSGTLADRMRGSAAQGRCRAKTGTLTGVSALSGYCFNRSGRKYAFSILMNDVFDTTAARTAQDRIASIVAGL
jgi:D-alanyl-D-alanine carboxypeptidase/D-alanyl-D-alanine-endopeptidase (penicillin-binding protein 4)